MKEDVIGYKMTKEVNKIVSLFQSKAFIKVEGKIKEKYLNAAATLIGEPIFISKGKFNEGGFEKGTLLNFETIKAIYLSPFKGTVFPLNKSDLQINDLGLKPMFSDIGLLRIQNHLESDYSCFYPYSPAYVKQIIEWKCEHILESYSGDSYDEDDECEIYLAKIDEETIWIANTYTKDFVDELTYQLHNVYELDEDSGISHNEVEGIKIDEESGIIQFYTWGITDDESESEHIRWDLYYTTSNDEDFYI